MKKFNHIMLALIVFLSLSISSFAHSGRTDSSGGHKDNQNASGLGSYHYHHGYGPHLHPGGACPYEAPVAAAVEVPVSTPQPTPSPTIAPKDTISISAKPSELFVGDNSTILYTLTTYSGSDEVIFTSSNTDIITVEGDTLIAVSKGEATITASLKNGSYSFSVKVKGVEPQTLELVDTPTSASVGDEIILTTTIFPENTDDKNILFSSSNEDVATVSNDGIVTILSSGEVIITATASNGISTDTIITAEDTSSSFGAVLILGGAGYYIYNKQKKKKLKFSK